MFWNSTLSRRRLIAAAALACGSMLALPLGAEAQDRLRMALPVKGASFAPIFLAIDGGYFAARDIDLQVSVLAGGPPAIMALLTGDVEFISVANDELLKVADTERIIRVYNYSNSFTQNLQVRNEVLEERGITLDMPVNERIRRLKGMTMGVIIPGGSSDLAGQWLFKRAGLDPTSEILIQRVGGLPALVASLRAGRIDGFVLSPPAGPIVEAMGVGKIVVRYDEIDEFFNEPFLGIDTRRDYLAANRDIVRRVVAAVAAAQKAVYDDPKAAAAKLHEGSFSEIELPTLERSLELMRVAYRSEKMTAEGWDFVKTMRVTLGRQEFAEAVIKEGVHWTNEFFGVD